MLAFKNRLISLIVVSTLLWSGFFIVSAKMILAQETPADEETITDAEEPAEPDPPVEPSADETIIADLNEQIKKQQDKIDALAEQINQHKENIKNAQNQTASLQNQIYILNNQIAKTNLDIKAKEEQAKIAELESEKIKIQIEENGLVIQKDKEQLSSFLRRLDRYDEKGYLTIILGNKSFSEFFDQIKYLDNIRKDLQKTVNRVQENNIKLAEQKKILDQKREELADLLNKLDSQKFSLDSQKQTKSYIVSETKQSEIKFQNLLAELKKEQASANTQIINLERQLRDELEKKGGEEKFNSFGEVSLIWPTSSRRLTCYFHDPEYPFRYMFEHSGIDIGIGQGTPVMAAETGYVAKVSTGTKWYGNYVMIIHNNNLSTLYAHLSGINVKPDQYVIRGQVIGASGNTGFSTGPHLHFEIRSNGIPVNPLSYLP